MWKKCCFGLSKYSCLVFWILESFWLLYALSPAPTEQTYLLFLPSSSEDILLGDTSRIFSSALRRGTKSCWNYSNRWAVSMEIKPCFPDEAFYSMVPITENPCGWPWADTFTLRIQSQAAISQQRLWLSFIFWNSLRHMNLCLYCELWCECLCMLISGLSLWTTFIIVYEEIIAMLLLILEELFVGCKE